MTPAEFRAARKSLSLTQGQLAAVLGFARPQSVSDIELGLANAGAAVVRLLRVYLAGYRPEDWPG